MFEPCFTLLVSFKQVMILIIISIEPFLSWKVSYYLSRFFALLVQNVVAYLFFKSNFYHFHLYFHEFIFISLLTKITLFEIFRRNQLIPIWQQNCWAVVSQCHLSWQLNHVVVSSIRLSLWVSQLRGHTVKEWSINILEMPQPCVSYVQLQVCGITFLQRC